MEIQKQLDLDTDLSNHEAKTIHSNPDDEISEDMKHDGSTFDDFIITKEKTNVEIQPPLENTFELIDQETKVINDVDNSKDVHLSKDEEKENFLKSDKISNATIEDLVTTPIIESPIKKDPIAFEKLESNVTNTIKTVQEIQPIKVIHSEVKITDTPVNISKMPLKKDTDEGDVCDIKIGPEELFCRIGLDKWFNPEKLPPKVEALVYWRDPVLSGIVFGTTLVVLLSFAYMSLISVVAYLAMFVQSGCIILRLYKTALQTVQKTTESHPFQEYLDMEIRLPQEKAEELSKIAVVHINAVLVEVRRLLLAEDLVDSIKFIGILWVLTYVGALFNGLTLIIIGFVALFTLPKVYENNKTQIDQNIDLVRSKIAELTNKVRAAIPIGKKTPETKKKE